MTADYSGDPSSTPKDEVRFLLRDTASPFELTNEEIYWALGESGSNTYLAAALCADTLVAKFAKYVDKSVGPLKISYKDQVTNYAELAKSLRSKAARFSGAGPQFTTPAKGSLFQIGMDDNPVSTLNTVGGDQP